MMPIPEEAKGRGDNEVPEVLGKALRGQLSTRELRCIGYSRETKNMINAIIAVSPVLEDALLDLAESAYSDGVAAGIG